MSVVVFPGQGAQRKGMGADLFKKHPQLCETADRILGYSIEELCLDDPNKALNQTQYTQPALYTVNALHYYDYLESAKAPQFLAGHSLGEYNALLAADVFDFETGLKLVQRRGQLMSQAENGGMLAVLRSSENEIKQILQSSQLDGVDIANYNSPSQLVLSASVTEIDKAKRVLEKHEVFCIPLKVSGAFHSRHMQSAADNYAQFLQGFSFKVPKIPVIANVTGQPYENETVQQLLFQQLSHSVQWTNSIRYLMGCGALDIHEVGPGQVLTKLNAEIISNTQPLKVEKTPQNTLDNTAAVKTKIDAPSKIPVQDILQNQGTQAFIKDYNLKHPYVAGSMCNGISSSALVARMAKSGYLAFLGTHGLDLNDIESMINDCKCELERNQAFGINVHYQADNLTANSRLIDVCLDMKVTCIEVSGYDHVSYELVKYRATGISKTNGRLLCHHKTLVKTAKTDVALAFMNPAPLHLLDKLLQENIIDKDQYTWAQHVPMADDVCVEGDGGWKTAQAVSLVKLPEVIRLRNKHMQENPNAQFVRIGSSGGLGTPEAIAAVFAMKADFVLTGSINQCTLEANVSDATKDILANIGSEDTICVPSGELFESGAKAQVVRKGLFFPARAQKLYDLYRLHSDLDALPETVKEQLETHFFNRSISDILRQTAVASDGNHSGESVEKHKMAQVFKWYFEQAKKLAIEGDEAQQDNYQIFSGPAMGAFNQWVKGSALENWRNRHVDDVADHLLESVYQLVAAAEKAA